MGPGKNSLVTFTSMLVLAFICQCHVPDIERFDPVSGELTGIGVQERVSVVRDKNGIVHISAENDRDLFLAIGFSMAQDRFVQMDEYRRAGAGELSALFGSPLKYKGIDLPHLDIALRTFGFGEEAEEGVASLDPESRKLLQAFVDGINLYLEHGGHTLAIYKALDTEPEPWTMEDCFVTSGIMGLSMTFGSMFEEYYLERIRIELGEDARDLFVQRYPEDAPVITSDRLHSSLAPSPLRSMGSNNWALSGERSESGMPLLCNDPHVPHSTIPTFWWHCHLSSPGFEVQGMMFAGLPCFGAAFNGGLGWALTNVGADYIDLWRERLNPEDPDQYLADGEWKEFDKVPGKVQVKGKAPVEYTMRLSRHGVVIDQELLGWKVHSAEGEVLAMRYVDMDMARFFKGYQDMARAQDFEQWLKGAKDMAWGPFAWNHVYADADGNIAYWTTGHIPVRPDNQGRFPRKGWEKDQQWRGWVPFEDNPHLVNPDKGYLVTANNRVEEPGYPYYIASSYSDPSRAATISELIEAKQKHDASDMQRIQYNVSVYKARRLAPLILSDLKGVKGRCLKKAAEIIEEWRGQGYVADADSRGTCVFEVFMNKLPGEVFEDELGDGLMTGAGQAGLLGHGLANVIDNPESPWFDDKSTKRVETREDITRRAMKKAMRYLYRNLGPWPRKWEWGKLSRIWISPSFFPIPGFTREASRGPWPLPGTGKTVRAAGQIFLGPLGFYGMVGPSTHVIVDFEDPGRALFNTTAGMSENERGGRYDNLMPAWINGEYRVMSMDEQDYRQGMMGELLLAP